jgi:hypothetical protein
MNKENGFWRNRTTVGQIIALWRILGVLRNRKLPLLITFIDFKKSFDLFAFYRGKLIHILQAYAVTTINKIYANTRAKVCTPAGDTKLFDILTGVLKGDTLTLILFIDALDYALRQEEQFGFTLTPRKTPIVPYNCAE